MKPGLYGLAIWFLVGCSGGLEATGEGDGWTRSYDAGTPDFDLEVHQISGDSVRVLLGVIPATLVFSEWDGGQHVARFRYEILHNGRSVVEGLDSLTTEEPVSDVSYERVVLPFELEAQEGALFEVRLEDAASTRSSRRRQAVVWAEFPGARIGRIALTRMGRVRAGFEIPADGVGLEATAYVQGSTGCLAWHLLSIPTDTLAASEPFSLSPSLGSRNYRGALYDEADTLATQWVPVEGPGMKGWQVPVIWELGVKRIELDWRPACETPLAEEAPVPAGRSAIVRPPGFPRLSRLNQMIPPLTYIATREEMASLQDAAGAAAQRQAFDAFWGRTIGDPVAASRAIGRFYGRVEEANKLYSGFKEGWKTDRGMIYLVLGPPLYVEDSVDELRWFYSYDERNPGRYFVFERVRGFPDELEVPQYVLKRSMEQEREWRLAVQRWRRGAVR